MRPSGAAHELGTFLSWGRCGPCWSGRLLSFSGPTTASATEELHMGVAQLEERRSPKPKVAGSTPVARADPRALGCSLRTPRRTMRDRVEHRPAEVPSDMASTPAPACCQRETQDAARWPDPAVSDGGLRDVVYQRAFLLWEQAGGVQLPASRLSRRAAQGPSARTKRPEEVMAVKDALPTNAAYQVITRVAWQPAITLVVTDLTTPVEQRPRRHVTVMVSCPLRAVPTRRTARSSARSFECLMFP